MLRSLHLSPLACFLGSLTLAIAFAAANGYWQGGFFRPPLPRLEQRSCAEVQSRLLAAGLKYRAVPTSRDGPCERSVYFTKTHKSWRELNTLVKVVERIEDWRGSVYCEKLVAREQQRFQVEAWGNNCLLCETFVFFGDRDMLEEIERALVRGAPPADYVAATAKVGPPG